MHAELRCVCLFVFICYSAIIIIIIVADIVHAMRRNTIMPGALATVYIQNERKAKVCTFTMQFEREIDESTFQRGIWLA